MIDYTKPEEIWKAYDAGRNYKSSIGLYETVEDNERFYVGDQWHGLDAPNIPKPVLNVLKRTVSMLVAKICADDIAANITPFLKDDASEERAKILSNEVDKVLELCSVKQNGKQALRNAAVDGDGCVTLYWDDEAPTGQDAKGMIKVELTDNINVIFENPHTINVQDQQYIIVARRLPVDEVRERAEHYGAKDIDEIVADDDTHQGEQGDGGKLVTLLCVFFRKEGTIHALEATEKVIVRKEWDTDLTRYPVAWLPWERQRNSMHGRAALTDMIPNQVAINKAYAGMLYEIERLGFHTLIVNGQFIKNWNGEPGKVIKVAGNPDDVRKYAAYIDGAQTNPSISNVIGEVITYTRDFMGTNDASSGNVRPDNASAIIALQNADTVPLELTRQAYNGFIEDIVRIIVDMMHAYYGTRYVEHSVRDKMTGKMIDEQIPFNFDELSGENLRINVDIGAASMWSEITQMDALNSLFTSGIMDDPRKFRLYIEIVPDKYVPGKAKLLQWCDEMEAQMQMNPYPNETPIDGELLNPYGNVPMGNTNVPTIAQEGMPNV
jgi:hypothetical protein